MSCSRRVRAVSSLAWMYSSCLEWLMLLRLSQPTCLTWASSSPRREHERFWRPPRAPCSRVAMPEACNRGLMNQMHTIIGLLAAHPTYTDRNLRQHPLQVDFGKPRCVIPGQARNPICNIHSHPLAPRRSSLPTQAPHPFSRTYKCAPPCRCPSGA
jgi:hypothetical protein